MPKQQTSAWLITHLYQQLSFDLSSKPSPHLGDPQVLMAHPPPILTEDGSSVWRVRRVRLHSAVIERGEFVLLGVPDDFMVGIVEEMFCSDDPKMQTSDDASVVIGIRSGIQVDGAPPSAFPAYTFPPETPISYRPLSDVAAKAMVFQDRHGISRLNTCYYGSAIFFNTNFLPPPPSK